MKSSSKPASRVICERQIGEIDQTKIDVCLKLQEKRNQLLEVARKASVLWPTIIRADECTVCILQNFQNVFLLPSFVCVFDVILFTLLPTCNNPSCQMDLEAMEQKWIAKIILKDLKVPG